MLFCSAERTFWLEPAASTNAGQHDLVFDVLLYTTTFFFILVMALMVFFVIAYRRRRGPLPVGGPTHHTALEIFWTAVPLVIVCAFFVVGLYGYADIETPAPTNADVVDVEAKQWSFTFTYPNGALSDVLYVQKDRPTSLLLHSSDVSHAVYIPAFRVQRNAVPGRITNIWFTPTRLDTYQLYCTQYCGNGHSRMATTCEVLDATAFSAKMAAINNLFVDPITKKPRSYREVGEKLYKMRGCAQCHTIDGTPGTGPTWKGLFKRDHQFAVAPPGYTLNASDDDAKWEAYIRESILQPDAKVVQGFQNVMPPQASSFSGTPAKEKMLTAIVEYIKSLDSSGPPQKYYKEAPMPKEDLPAVDAHGAPMSSAGPQVSANPQSSAAPQSTTTAKAIETPAAKPTSQGSASQGSTPEGK